MLASFIVVDLKGELCIPLLTLKTFQTNLHLGEMKNVSSPCEYHALMRLHVTQH